MKPKDFDINIFRGSTLNPCSVHFIFSVILKEDTHPPSSLAGHNILYDLVSWPGSVRQQFQSPYFSFLIEITLLQTNDQM